MTVPVIRNPIGSPPSEHELMVYNTMAKQAVGSKFYKGIGDEAAVMMIMLSARELGLPPVQAINGGLNIINGKVEISARMMSGMIRRAGHSIKIVTETDDLCVLLGTRIDNGDTAKVSFSVDEAKRAGLYKPGGNWTKYPKDMCFARALSRLARQLFSDVIGTGYVEGEIQAAEYKVVEPQEEHHGVTLLDTVIPTKQSDFEFGAMNDITEYMKHFTPEEETDAHQYFTEVKNHFGWDVIAAVQNMTSDPDKLREKFNAWKAKKATS